MDDHDRGHEFEWNDIYTGNASDYMEADPQLLEIIDDLRPGRALDLGCGSGGLVVALVERGWEVTGVDLAPRAIEAAREVLVARGLHAELQVADAAAWRPRGRFDLITNSFALPAERGDQAKVFATVRQALAPGGVVLIKDFDAGMQRHEEFARFHCPTMDELVAAFAGFAIVRAEVVETSHHDHGHAHADAQGEADDSRRTSLTAALLHARSPSGSR